ncbi:hypothetical protein NL676_034407 [Syzygium grande]|nr:hypothetical protein NL676_034407 [Syzygium grande]
MAVTVGTNQSVPSPVLEAEPPAVEVTHQARIGLNTSPDVEPAQGPILCSSWAIVRSVTPAAGPSNLVHKFGQDEQRHRDEGWVHVHSRRGKAADTQFAPGPNHCHSASAVGLDQPSSISLVPQDRSHTVSPLAPAPPQLPPSVAVAPDHLLQNPCPEQNITGTE